MPCAGGPGCHQADYLRALEAWVEQGQAPDQMQRRKIFAAATMRMQAKKL
jgi:hypothetical protein